MKLLLQSSNLLLFFFLLPASTSIPLLGSSFCPLSSLLCLLCLLLLSSFFIFHPLYHIDRASPATQEAVCSSGRSWISPSPPPLADGWFRLLPAEVLHSAGQGAAQRGLENTYRWCTVQCDHLDRWQVRMCAHIYSTYSHTHKYIHICCWVATVCWVTVRLTSASKGWLSNQSLATVTTWQP